MPRAEPEQPGGAEGGLRELLERARLVKHHQALVDLGAESVLDLEDVTTDQLQRIGMRELEIDRLRKATNGGTMRRQGSLLVKPRGTESGSHGGDHHEQLLPGGGRRSVSDFAQLQRTSTLKLEKTCGCCTRRQLLVAVGTLLTSVIAGVASVLVKNYLEQKEHKDAPICVSAIERCAHSECSTGAVAVCTQCDDGFYIFRHDENAARCIEDSTTLAAAGYDKDPHGIYSFRLQGGVIPSDLRRGTELTVPAAASLAIRGSGAELLGSTVKVTGGALDLTRLQLTTPAVSVDGGGKLTMSTVVVLVAKVDITDDAQFRGTGCRGSLSAVSINGAGFMMDASSTIDFVGKTTVTDAGAVSLRGKTFSGRSSLVISGKTVCSIAASALPATAIAVSSGAELKLSSCHGGLTSLEVSDAAFGIDAATSTVLNGTVRFDNAGKVDLVSKRFTTEAAITIGAGTDCTISSSTIPDGAYVDVDIAGKLNMADVHLLGVVASGSDLSRFQASLSMVSVANGQLGLSGGVFKAASLTISGSNTTCSIDSTIIPVNASVDMHGSKLTMKSANICGVMVTGEASNMETTANYNYSRTGAVTPSSHMSVHGGQLTLSGGQLAVSSLSVSGAGNSIAVEGTHIIAASMESSSSAQLSLQKCTGSITGVSASSSVFTMDSSSTAVLSGVLSFSSAGDVSFSGHTFSSVGTKSAAPQLTVGGLTKVHMQNCGGSLGGIHVTSAATFISDSPADLKLGGILEFSSKSMGRISGTFNGAQLQLEDSSVINLMKCEGTLDGISAKDSSLALDDESTIRLGGASHMQNSNVWLHGITYASAQLEASHGTSLNITHCDGNMGKFNVSSDSHVKIVSSRVKVSGMTVDGRKDTGNKGSCLGVTSRPDNKTCTQYQGSCLTKVSNGKVNCCSKWDPVCDGSPGSCCSSSGSVVVCQGSSSTAAGCKSCTNIVLGSTVRIDSMTAVSSTFSCSSRYSGPVCDVVPKTCRSYYNHDRVYSNRCSGHFTCGCNGCGDGPCGCDGAYGGGSGSPSTYSHLGAPECMASDWSC